MRHSPILVRTIPFFHGAPVVRNVNILTETASTVTTSIYFMTLKKRDEDPDGVVKLVAAKTPGITVSAPSPQGTDAYDNTRVTWLTALASLSNHSLIKMNVQWTP